MTDWAGFLHDLATYKLTSVSPSKLVAGKSGVIKLNLADIAAAGCRRGDLLNSSFAPHGFGLCI